MGTMAETEDAVLDKLLTMTRQTCVKYSLLQQPSYIVSQPAL